MSHRMSRRECTAKSKRTGKLCGAQPMKGKTVCYHHGGKSLAGKDSPSYKTGRFSKYLPDRLAEKYEEALSDPELISLSNELALVDSQLTTQLELWHESGMARDGWTRARNLFNAFRRHTNAGDQLRALDDLEALRVLLDEGNENVLAWKFIGELIESRRRLVETERKRLSDEDHAVSIDKLMLFMGALLDIIRRRVGDEGIQREIAQDVRALMAGTSKKGEPN